MTDTDKPNTGEQRPSRFLETDRGLIVDYSEVEGELVDWFNDDDEEDATTPMHDRALGALLGLAVGDALGTTLEFSRRDSKPVLTDMIGGGPFGLRPGEWTDDTSMALALADSLETCGGLDERDLMQRFVRWWRQGDYSHNGRRFDIGATTAAALARFERTGKAIAGDDRPDSAGNGSLMRLAPVAIMAGADVRGYARRQSATTHAAPACLDACEGAAVLIASLVAGMDWGAALASVPKVESPEVVAVFTGSWRGKDRDGISSSGYVVHSLEAALWAVDSTSDFRDALLLAANLGDDADTVAAIAGQFAGARYGATGIPAEWLGKLAWRERIESAALALM